MKSRQLNPRQRMGRLRKLVLVGSAAGTVAGFFGLLAPFHVYVQLVVIVLCLAGIGWGVGFVLSMKYLKFPGSHRLKTSPIPISDSEIALWDSTLSDESLTFLLTMLWKPKRYTRRISETVRFEDKSIAVSTTLTIDVPYPFSNHEILLPVYDQPRGSLVDGLVITSQSGERMSSLAQRDSAHIILAMLLRMIARLEPMRLPKSASAAAKDAHRQECEMARAEVVAIAKEIVTSTDSAEARGRFDALVAKDGPILKLRGDFEQVDLLIRTLFRVTENYPVMIGLPLPTTIRNETLGSPISNREVGIVVSRVDAPEYPVNGRWLSRRIRSTLYVGPPRLNFALRRAALAHSYHLLVHSPPGMYFYELRPIKGYLSKKGGVPTAEYSGENISGHQLQSSGHYYVRDGADLSGYLAEISFKERIPGSISQAFIWSALFTVLAISSFVSHSTSFGSVAGFLFPALFAAITTGSAWQGVRQLSEPFGGRFISRVSLIATAGLCVTAIVQASLDAVPKCLTCVGPALSNGQVLIWAIVLTLALTNTTTMGVFWFADSQIEQWFMHGRAKKKEVRS